MRPGWSCTSFAAFSAAAVGSILMMIGEFTAKGGILRMGLPGVNPGDDPGSGDQAFPTAE